MLFLFQTAHCRNSTLSVNSISDDRPVKRCKYKLRGRWVLFILSDLVYFSSIERIDGVIGLTAAGYSAMTKDGVETAACWNNVTLCMTARRNILSED